MSTGPQLPNTFSGWAIAIVVCLAIAGLVYVMIQVTGIPIPAWFWTVCFIVLVAVIIIAAIKFVSRMGGNP